MKSNMHNFFKTYFNATAKTNNWASHLFNAEQRNEMLNDVMQWDYTRSSTKK